MLISAVTYVNADHEVFLFDDNKDVLTNPMHTRSVGEAFRVFGREQLSSDAPLTYLTFALTHAFNRAVGLPGADVTSFLVVNVAIHAVNAWLVYLLVRALFRQAAPDRPAPAWVPLAVAVLFAVHPIHASSVAYIIQRRGLLATTFCLLAVLSWLRGRSFRRMERAAPASAPGPASRPLTGHWGSTGAIAWAAVALACCWLSFRSKNMGIIAPLVILAVELCLRAAERRLGLRQALCLAGAAGLCGTAMLLFLWSRGLLDPRRLEISPFGENADWGPWAHFLTECRVFVHYGKLLLLPLPRWSCIDHSFAVSRSLLDHYAVAAAALHGVLLAAVVPLAARRRAPAAVGILWFYIALVPYAVLPQAEIFVEYKTYLPSVGLALIVAEVLRTLAGRVAIRWLAPAVAIAGAALFTTTLYRNRIYRSPLALWADAAAKAPGHARPHYNYALALHGANRLDEAIAEYEQALRLNPRVPQIHNNLGISLMKRRRLSDAIRRFEEAIRLDPRFASAHNNLGSAMYEAGDRVRAADCYREALRLAPDYADARHNLATTLAELGEAALAQGDADRAVACLRESVQVLPSMAELHFALGNALAAGGSLEDAGECYRQAIRQKPGYAEAHTHLGNVLTLQGRRPEAIASFRDALRHNPALVAARFGLANLLAESGQIDEAVRQYEEILRLDPNHPHARARLEAARGHQPRGDTR